MASLSGLIRFGGQLVCLLVCLLMVFSNSGVLARRICWQAIMLCQREPDCSFAYEQYTEACRSVLNLETRRCPSHCLSALIHLNQTQNGPMLENCDCVHDELCKSTKRAIEPCLPRTRNRDGVMGCTEARLQCEMDSQCNNAMRRYLQNCGKLFNGIKCTESCREVIESMLVIPKALLLKECICDGSDRPICEAIKDNMARLCFFGPEHSSGSSGSDMEPDEYWDYEDDPTDNVIGYNDDNNRGTKKYASSARDSSTVQVPNVLTLMASILLLLLLIARL
ncbi:growth arrest-specific protein 1 [Amblyraja radiata]|uniref:growth arrest-specific protein 1 n=1 Tax=Amblyraja radiata TaxID=386614 RepID=UPI0014030E5D|nr:growth arrest-specific protein 1 [Amblyraja radiata]